MIRGETINLVSFSRSLSISFSFSFYILLAAEMESWTPQMDGKLVALMLKVPQELKLFEEKY